MFDGDRVRLKQVVLNLLSNAIRYTNAGTVTITAGEGTDDTLGQVVRLAIRDTGVGIKPEDLGRLFQQFTQLDGSSSRKIGGTGLGLAISAHYAAHARRPDRRGQRIRQGTEFTVVLPIQGSSSGCFRAAIEASTRPPNGLSIDSAEGATESLRENPTDASSKYATDSAFFASTTSPIFSPSCN